MCGIKRCHRSLSTDNQSRPTCFESSSKHENLRRPDFGLSPQHLNDLLNRSDPVRAAFMFPSHNQDQNLGEPLPCMQATFAWYFHAVPTFSASCDVAAWRWTISRERAASTSSATVSRPGRNFLIAKRSLACARGPLQIQKMADDKMLQENRQNLTSTSPCQPIHILGW